MSLGADLSVCEVVAAAEAGLEMVSSERVLVDMRDVEALFLSEERGEGRLGSGSGSGARGVCVEQSHVGQLTEGIKSITMITNKEYMCVEDVLGST